MRKLGSGKLLLHPCHPTVLMDCAKPAPRADSNMIIRETTPPLRRDTLLAILRDCLKMLGATRSGVIQAGDVDRQDTRPYRRHREEDQALPDGPDGCGMGAHQTLAAATGEARTQAQC